MSAHRYVIIACINYTIAFTNIGFGAAQVTDHLNPSPNLLQFPSRPGEVNIQRNQTITLEQALELARGNNLELQGLLFQVERSRAALREVEAGMYPAISLSADLSRAQSAFSQLYGEQLGEQAQFLATQRLSQDEPITTFSGSLELTYGLYNFGPGASSRGAAQEQVRLDELEVERLSEEIRLNIMLDYYNLQQADEQVRINLSAVQNAQASLQDTQAREQAGVGTKFDVLQAQVNLANAQQELTNAISQQQISRRQLATRLNLAQSVNISAADPVQLAGLWQLTLEETIILSLQNRPELKQRLVERRIAQLRQKVVLSRLKPQISFVSSYNLQDVFDDRASVLNGYSLGVQGSLRVFDGGTVKAQAAQRNVEIRIAETQFANQSNNIRFEVEQAYSQLQSNLDNVQTSSLALNEAREALNLGRLRFQAGVSTQTDVISAENDLTRAEGNRIQAILDYNRALAKLQRSVTFR